MADENQEILKDDDLEDLFGEASDKEESEKPPVTHIPVPTPQIKIGAAAKPSIQIQIPGAGGIKGGATGDDPQQTESKKSYFAVLVRIADSAIGIVDRALDLANKPFWWMGASVRKYVGIVATVTLIMSILAIVLVPKLFPRYDAARVLDGLHLTPATATAAESDSAP